MARETAGADALALMERTATWLRCGDLNDPETRREWANMLDRKARAARKEAKLVEGPFSP